MRQLIIVIIRPISIFDAHKVTHKC